MNGLSYIIVIICIVDRFKGTVVLDPYQDILTITTIIIVETSINIEPLGNSIWILSLIYRSNFDRNTIRKTCRTEIQNKFRISTSGQLLVAANY